MWTSSAPQAIPFCISTRRRAPSCREDRSESGGDLVTVPNLTDMSYDAACATLKSLGLNVSEKGVTGGGKTIVVTEQDIAADTQVEIGSVIEVTFHDTTVLD